MASLKDVILWLFVFIVGSLIVTWIVSPDTFPLSMNNVKSLAPEPDNVIELIPAQMEEYNLPGGNPFTVWTCAMLEATGESAGVKDMKGKQCAEVCGKRQLDYYSNECRANVLVCHCKS